MLSAFQMPFEYQTIIGHLNIKQVKASCSDFSAIQMFTIKIPTVFGCPCISYLVCILVCQFWKLCKYFRPIFAVLKTKIINLKKGVKIFQFTGIGPSAKTRVPKSSFFSTNHRASFF